MSTTSTTASRCTHASPPSTSTSTETASATSRPRRGSSRWSAGAADGVAVLDRDDDFAYPRLAGDAGGHAAHLQRRRRATPTSSPRTSSPGRAGSHSARARRGERQPCRLRLAGRFNAGNALAALAAACSSGATFDAAVAGISALERVHGRMERVDLGQPFSVVIDYAHTADSLAKVLAELRAATAGRLWVVFGSAGERDVDKRAAMGDGGRHASPTSSWSPTRTRAVRTASHLRADRRRRRGRRRAPRRHPARHPRPRRGDRVRAARRGTGRHRPVRRQGSRELDHHRLGGGALGRARRRRGDPQLAGAALIPLASR